MHTLDITEIYVRLVEGSAKPSFVISDYKSGVDTDMNVGILTKLVAFDPEPWCHVQVGHMTLKPDAYIDLGDVRWFLEMDRGTEYRSALQQKMRRYVHAYKQWPDEVFPQVLFVVHDEDRVRFIKSVIRQTEIPALFAVTLFDDAIKRMTVDN